MLRVYISNRNEKIKNPGNSELNIKVIQTCQNFGGSSEVCVTKDVKLNDHRPWNL